MQIIKKFISSLLLKTARSLKIVLDNAEDRFYIAMIQIEAIKIANGTIQYWLKINRKIAIMTAIPGWGVKSLVERFVPSYIEKFSIRLFAIE